MTFGLNLLMLLGLAGIAIPLLVHLLTRRRFDVVDWGAMQFLQVSQTTRRRILIEELLLMLLRMGLIAVLVIALAAPYVESTILAKLGGRPNRDVVLILDGSASMSAVTEGKSTHQAALEWVDKFLGDLTPGDSVALLQGKEQTIPVIGQLTSDVPQARAALADLSAPRGGCDWREAIRSALRILTDSHRAEREVILISDNQSHGWADDTSLLRWELFATELRQVDKPPRIWMVNLASQRPAHPANWAIAPIRASRAVASLGQEIKFRTALELHGQEKYQSPYRLRLEVDGQAVGDLTPPTAARRDKGQVPLTFTHRFVTPGSHLVSLILEPDPPLEKRPPGYVVVDVMPADNRQDLAVEVLPALPVLLVDGDTRPDPKYRGTDFLRDALSPARDANPAVLIRVVPIQDFVAGQLNENIGKESGTRPRVLVISNVAALTKAQEEAVSQFLADGGGVLVTLGERVDAQAYNDQLYRRGQGWLPARLDDMAGNESDLARASTPLASSFFHPSLELFRDAPTGGLADARFPRWWKVTTVGRGAAGVPVALLSSNDPLIVERSFQNGRVLMTTVPLDNSWRTNLPDLAAFAPLAHELVFYLAGTRSVEHNLQPGQPLRLFAETDKLSGFKLTPPFGPTWPLSQGSSADSGSYPVRVEQGARGNIVVYEGTRESGVYRISGPNGDDAFFVVQSDARESELGSCSTEQRDRVARQIPLTYVDDPTSLMSSLTQTSQRRELWWLFLIAVIVMLCGEVWLTRRIVRGR